jgi:hypothetical protein
MLVCHAANHDVQSTAQGMKLGSTATMKVPIKDSKAHITPWEDIIATQQFSRSFRERFAKYSLNQLHIIGHWIATHRRYDNHSVPLPYNAIMKSGLSSLYRKGELDQLVEDGIFERTEFSIENHQCREYTAGHVLLDVLRTEMARFKIEEFLLQAEERVVRLGDGKLYGHHNHDRTLMTPLNKKALNCLAPNLVNVTALDAHYETLKARAYGLETYAARKIALLRLTDAYQHILRLKAQRKTGTYPQRNGEVIIGYIPCYKGSTTGRLYERGGMQGIRRDFKRAGYSGLYNLLNLDVRSCHINIIAELCRKAGSPIPLLEDYAQAPQAKISWAQQANIPIDLWKECMIGLLYGARMGEPLKKKIAFWYQDNVSSYTKEDIERAYENFQRVALPFLTARQTWHKILRAKIIPQHTQKHRKGQPDTLKNACGAEVPLDEFGRDINKIAAFICQGIESAFICHLTCLSKEHGFKVRSLEHDGMVVTNSLFKGLFPIVPYAVEQARELSGFDTAMLEEKPF